ncbi:MAG: DUF6537 domain-containing protein, partial [Pseudomonadota bacterium]
AAILGMAAHLEGKGCAALDMIGVAQKGGAVMSHLKIGANPDSIGSARLGAGGADLVLGCDRVVAASPGATATMEHGKTTALINGEAVMPGNFTREPDFRFPAEQLDGVFDDVLGPDHWQTIQASELARRLVGDAIGANLFMVGLAYQKGLVPLSSEAIERAIELNHVAVATNLEIFRWGRRAGHDLGSVLSAAGFDTGNEGEALSLDGLIERNVNELTHYQSRRYAKRYADFVARIRQAEAQAMPGRIEFTTAVALYLFKLMAFKDEYEVARLYTSGDFQAQLAQEFEGDYRLELHLAPPLLSRTDPRTGRPAKRRFGPWILRVLNVLKHGKRLRGTPLDMFGYSAERKQERALIAEYCDEMETLGAGLTEANYSIACALAELPEQIRGYGPVKAASLQNVEMRKAELWASLDEAKAAGRPALQAAE